MFPPTFIIKPHTSHKQYTTKYCLQILEEKNENGTGRIPDPSDFSEGVWSRETNYCAYNKNKFLFEENTFINSV